MVKTPNLGIEHIPATARQKTPVFDTAMDELDKATQAELEVAITGDRVLTALEYTRSATFKLTGTPGTPFNLTVPDGDRDFAVFNTTDTVATVKATSAGTTVAVAAGGRAVIRADAADLEIFLAGAGAMTEYFSASVFVPARTNGSGDLASVQTTSGNPDLVGLPFSSTVEERAHVHFVLPKRWNLGTLFYQIEYAHVGGQTAGLDGTAWLVDAVAVDSLGSINVSYGTAVGVTADLAAANTLHRPPLSGALTVKGLPTEGEVIFLRVRREIGNAADDLDIDAIFLGVRLIWVADEPVDD